MVFSVGFAGTKSPSNGKKTENSSFKILFICLFIKYVIFFKKNILMVGEVTSSKHQAYS